MECGICFEDEQSARPRCACQIKFCDGCVDTAVQRIGLACLRCGQVYDCPAALRQSEFCADLQLLAEGCGRLIASHSQADLSAVAIYSFDAVFLPLAIGVDEYKQDLQYELRRLHDGEDAVTRSMRLFSRIAAFHAGGDEEPLELSPGDKERFTKIVRQSISRTTA